MDKNLSAIAWAGKFLNGDFNDKDLSTQCDAGWWDWFCNDESLARKTQVLGKKVTKLLGSDTAQPMDHYSMTYDSLILRPVIVYFK
jgi:hypothetical protein